MTVLTKISRMFKPANARRSRPAAPSAAPANGHVRSAHARPQRSRSGGRKQARLGDRCRRDGPVARMQPALADSRVLAAAKTKQELLAELQQNYREVVDLVRRVKSHMETQDERFDRLMGIAEQIRKSVEAAPGLREDARKALVALDQLATTQRDGQARTETALQAHSGRLNRMTELMENSSETEQRVASTLSDVGATLSAMATATENVGGALRAMQEREAKRDAELAGLLTRSHRWMVAITAVVGVAIAAGLIFAALLAN
jgi:chromosome segregation ATPase